MSRIVDARQPSSSANLALNRLLALLSSLNPCRDILLHPSPTSLTYIPHTPSSLGQVFFTIEQHFPTRRSPMPTWRDFGSFLFFPPTFDLASLPNFRESSQIAIPLIYPIGRHCREPDSSSKLYLMLFTTPRSMNWRFFSLGELGLSFEYSPFPYILLLSYSSYLLISFSMDHQSCVFFAQLGKAAICLKLLDGNFTGFISASSI